MPAQVLSNGYFLLWKFSTYSSKKPQINPSISSFSLTPFLLVCVTFNSCCQQLPYSIQRLNNSQASSSLYSCPF